MKPTNSDNHANNMLTMRLEKKFLKINKSWPKGLGFTAPVGEGG